MTTLNDIDPGTPSHLTGVRSSLRVLALDVRRGAHEHLSMWHERLADSPYRGCAANLASYLDLRQHDVRALQDELSLLGLSSLGRAEAHVRASLAAVDVAVSALLGDRVSAERVGRIARLSERQAGCLTARTDALFGAEPPLRRTRIMVTLPSEAVTDPAVTHALVEAGMDVARINGAHDGPEAWRAMARHVRDAARKLGRVCKIQLDLPGPKLRVAPLPSVPGRLRIRAADVKHEPLTIILDGNGGPGRAGDADGPPRVAVPPDWLAQLAPGDLVTVVDAHGRPRSISIGERTGDHEVRASVHKNLQLIAGLELRGTRGATDLGTTTVGPFEPREGHIRVRVGDRVRLVERAQLPLFNADSTLPWLACQHDAVVQALRVGNEVLFDDGHVESVVESVGRDGVILEIAATRRATEELRGEQGMNFRGARLHGHGLGLDDLEAIDVAVEVADIIGLSFAQGPEDVDALNDALKARTLRDLAVIAKIETQQGIEMLPEIIVAGASSRPFGVMIARGDLAAEIGYERLAEIQEELLWVCEAAHVPVVWATQVLESLVKTGVPTRAEITDAAMAQRAECVMLNKGEHIHEGVETLVDILTRMRGHQRKKTPRLRALHSW